MKKLLRFHSNIFKYSSNISNLLQYVLQTSTVRIVTLSVGIARITMFATTSQGTVQMVVNHSGRETGVMVRM